MNLASKITIPSNRQRKHFPASEEDKLITSITLVGLLHPIIVREDGETLVAGERRFRAIQKIYEDDPEAEISFAGAPIPHGTFPVIQMSELSDLEAETIELEENTIRLDISWQEKAVAIERLRKLRTAQASASGEEIDLKEIYGKILNADTSKQADPSSIIKDSKILVEHLHIPEVAKAKTKKEALKEIERFKRQSAMAERAEELKMIETKHTVIHGAFEEAELPMDFFDCVIVDPPYGIEASKFGSQPAVKHEYNDSEEEALRIFRALLKESALWTKAEAHMYIFCSIDKWPLLSEIFMEEILTPWTLWPRPLIWDKGNGILPRPEHGPRYTYEAIMFFSRGNKKVTGVFPDVLKHRVDLDLTHGAQKPVGLYAELLQRSCSVGDHVLDPCAGSGPIIVAAEMESCRATAVEKSEEYYKICLNRLDQLNIPL